ncbi:MAG: SsrA-binding protein SmpB [Candidatus Magasanikbacteria bacterium]
MIIISKEYTLFSDRRQKHMPTLAKNKKARFDYEILDTLEAGLVLSGQEVKSIRNGGAKLTGGFITFHKEKPVLTNAHISKYKHAGSLENYDPSQPRIVLLKDKEIRYLRGKLEEKGLTIVPLSLYTKGRRIKLGIGIAKGKKKYDKRRTIKDKELKRKLGRVLKEQM